MCSLIDRQLRLVQDRHSGESIVSATLLSLNFVTPRLMDAVVSRSLWGPWELAVHPKPHQTPIRDRPQQYESASSR